MTPWLSFFPDKSLCVALTVAGAAVGLEPVGQQVNDTGIAGVIARPPLLFLAALLLGLAADRLLPWPFAVPGTDPAYWMSAGSMILVGLAPAATAGPAIPSISACFSSTAASV